MISLRSQLSLAANPILRADDRVLALGSCFAERVGGKIRDSLFQTDINPTGILYNPVTLAGALSSQPRHPQLFLHQGVWRSQRHHSRFSSPNLVETQSSLAKAEINRRTVLESSTLLLLTLGTAHVYRLGTNGEVVANCHRLPQKLFRRELLSPQRAFDILAPALQSWLSPQQERRVLLTISPVRYLRDGLVESQRSKAVLHLLVQELCRWERVDYFPAYEIVMDELRDYRFYERDLVQPNDLAVDIIWERFRKTAMTPEATLQVERAQSLLRFLAHRPGAAKAEKHAELCRQRVESFQKEFPQAELSTLRAWKK